MLASFRKRIEREDEGFTLIELMVVVLIIAILLAIAIPTFLGARERAQNRAAQSDIRNALAAEKVYYTDVEAYTTDNTTLKLIEPALTFTTATADSKTKVFLSTNVVGTVADAVVCIGKTSASGKAFSLQDTAIGASAGTLYYGPNDVNCSGTGTSDGW
ncbi:MAG TPA: prepilin-type N-terminal cleavage/methylation domain-containing protein [Acidimicrobiales bacterium]